MHNHELAALVVCASNPSLSNKLAIAKAIVDGLSLREILSDLNIAPQLATRTKVNYHSTLSKKLRELQEDDQWTMH